MLFKLAWRNIWRNKRRTLITVASIFFAVLFSVFMNSFQKGAWVRMLDNIVNYYYGYAQIHQNGYWEDRTIDDSMDYTHELHELPNKIEGLKDMVPRLETFTLLSSGQYTNALMLVGTDPEKENNLTALKEKITEGAYFSADDKSLLVADGVKDLLKIKLGDTLIVMTQGFRGVQAAGKYPVTGFVHFASPELNKSMVYLPLKEVQYLLGAENRLTSLALQLDSRDDLSQVVAQVTGVLDMEQYEVMDWKELLPDLVEAQKTDTAGNYIFLFVLYLIISFGVFGTILMMVKERMYEFGVLLAIGMSRAKLALTTWLEIIFMAMIGALLGILGALPLVFYFYKNPIDFSQFGEEMANTYKKWGFDPIFPTVIESQLFYSQALLVFLITTILAGYAIWKIIKLKPIKAMQE
ncbi:MAG: transporter [Flavobacteriales bacterium]|nr:MAG: transporter [Flavobacteriales bacterium]